jgi:hypothetical protein
VSSRKPPWWRAFDHVERAIGRPLEDAANSNRAVDVMVRGMKLQRALGGAVGRLAGGATERVLRVANIPSRGEIRRLNRQLAVLTSEVRALSADQQEALAALRRARGRTARSARSAPPASDPGKGRTDSVEPHQALHDSPEADDAG